MLRASLVTALSLAMFSACGPIIGSGRYAEEDRAVGNWRVVHVEDTIHVNVINGAPGVRLGGDDNLIREVETVLQGDALVIRLPPGVWFESSLGLTATVSGERFEGGKASGDSSLAGAATPCENFDIEVSGSSKAMIADLDSVQAKVAASGASAVTLTGHANRLIVNASGSSSVDALGTTATLAEVEGSGASQLKLNVRDSISGGLSGSSQLMLQGGADSRGVRTSGSATVIRN